MKNLSYINQIFLFFLLFIFTASCRKPLTVSNLNEFNEPCADKCYIIEGYVTEVQSGDSISDFQLSLTENNRYILQNTTTNDSGFYTFSIPAYISDLAVDRNVEVINESEVFLNDPYLLAYHFLDSTMVDVSQNSPINIVSATGVDIHIKVSSNFHFNFLEIFLEYNFVDISDRGYILHGGKAIDTTFTVPFPIDVTRAIKWNTLGGTSNAQGQKTLKISKNESKKINIIF